MGEAAVPVKLGTVRVPAAACVTATGEEAVPVKLGGVCEPLADCPTVTGEVAGPLTAPAGENDSTAQAIGCEELALDTETAWFSESESATSR